MQSLEEVAICDVYPYERADGEPMNPRDFTTRESAEHITGLAAQFKANRLNPGQPVMKPILYKEGGIYWIIDGECRVRAMRAIGTERFLAEVYDDLDDAELARVEAAKAMVETDAKLGLTAEEKSRGVQTMLALDIPDEEVAVAARTDARTVAKARRAARRVQDAAYDMTLDRLAAIAEFEGDDEAVAELRDCKQSEWQRVYASLKAKAEQRRNRAEVVAVLADAGVEFVDECPGGFAACRTFSDYRPDLAALDAYVADNAGAGRPGRGDVVRRDPAGTGGGRRGRGRTGRSPAQGRLPGRLRGRREGASRVACRPRGRPQVDAPHGAGADLVRHGGRSRGIVRGAAGPAHRPHAHRAGRGHGLAGSVEHERLDGLEPHGRRQLRVLQPSDGRERDHHLRGHEGRRLRAERGRDGNLRGVHGAPGKRGVNERSS